MPKKYMSDFQRVKAGVWIENQKAWIATDPSIQMIAAQATKELGHRVTTTFVRSYLNETDWFAALKKSGEPVPSAKLSQALDLTLEALDLIVFSESKPDEIARKITMARSLIGSSSISQPRKQLDLMG